MKNMDNAVLKVDEKGHGGFYIKEGEHETGEMIVHIAPSVITVYHTEVSPEAEGKGLAKKLLNAMVNYAREHHLKVIPLCAYVHAQFKRHPQEFEDIWRKVGDKD